MPAATPHLYFQTLCQHEVFRVISTVNVGSLCTRHVTMATAFPLGRKFPSRRIFWCLEGNLEGNSICKEMRRKSCFEEKIVKRAGNNILRQEN